MAHKIYVDNVTVIDAATMNDVDAVVYTNSKLVTDIHTAPPKATPVDADELGIWNSVGSVLGKVTFSNLWLWIAAYTGNVTNKTFTTGNAFNGTLGATTPAAVTATTVTATTASGLLDLKTNTALADAAATLTAAQLRGGEFTITPTAARILTTDTAANIIANLTGSVDNSNYEITIVNLAAFYVTLATGVGVTIVGRAVINNGSATFRVRRLTSTTVEVKRLEGAESKAVGQGQTWTNMTASRALTINYVNTTGRPIVVSAHFSLSTGNGLELLTDGGVLVTRFSGNATTVLYGSLTAVIATDGNYQIRFFAGAAVTDFVWNELR
jgi:hypothetical protein